MVCQAWDPCAGFAGPGGPMRNATCSGEGQIPVATPRLRCCRWCRHWHTRPARALRQAPTASAPCMRHTDASPIPPSVVCHALKPETFAGRSKMHDFCLTLPYAFFGLCRALVRWLATGHLSTPSAWLGEARELTWWRRHDQAQASHARAAAAHSCAAVFAGAQHAERRRPPPAAGLLGALILGLLGYWSLQRYKRGAAGALTALLSLGARLWPSWQRPPLRSSGAPHVPCTRVAFAAATSVCGDRHGLAPCSSADVPHMHALLPLVQACRRGWWRPRPGPSSCRFGTGPSFLWTPR